MLHIVLGVALTLVGEGLILWGVWRLIKRQERPVPPADAMLLKEMVQRQRQREARP